MSDRFSISNIAWDRFDDSRVFALLHRYGITGIEVAPGKIWNDLLSATDQDVKRIRDFFSGEGFGVPALQAILFGRPELQVFDRRTHQSFLAYLRHIAQIAEGLGCHILIFGAPKNRRRGELCWKDAESIAIDFFHQAGELVQAYGCTIGLEANPADYQCDFLTNTADLYDFIRKVDCKGVKLHFDTGSVLLNGNDILPVLKRAGLPIHCHISAPRLENPVDFACDLHTPFRYLKTIGYEGTFSIEMKKMDPELPNLERALKYVKEALDAAEIGLL